MKEFINLLRIANKYEKSELKRMLGFLYYALVMLGPPLFKPFHTTRDTILIMIALYLLILVTIFLHVLRSCYKIYKKSQKPNFYIDSLLKENSCFQFINCFSLALKSKLEKDVNQEQKQIIKTKKDKTMKKFLKILWQTIEAWHKRLILYFIILLIMSIHLLVTYYCLTPVFKELLGLNHELVPWCGIAGFGFSWIALMFILLDIKDCYALYKESLTPNFYSKNKNTTIKRTGTEEIFFKKLMSRLETDSKIQNE